jgi:hypothetical protein
MRGKWERNYSPDQLGRPMGRSGQFQRVAKRRRLEAAQSLRSECSGEETRTKTVVIRNDPIVDVDLTTPKSVV